MYCGNERSSWNDTSRIAIHNAIFKNVCIGICVNTGEAVIFCTLNYNVLKSKQIENYIGQLLKNDLTFDLRFDYRSLWLDINSTSLGLGCYSGKERRKTYQIHSLKRVHVIQCCHTKKQVKHELFISWLFLTHVLLWVKLLDLKTKFQLHEHDDEAWLLHFYRLRTFGLPRESLQWKHVVWKVCHVSWYLLRDSNVHKLFTSALSIHLPHCHHLAMHLTHYPSNLLIF